MKLQRLQGLSLCQGTLRVMMMLMIRMMMMMMTMMMMMKHQIFTPVWGRISESPGSRCTLEPLEGQRAAMTIIIPMTMTMTMTTTTMTTTTTTAMMMMVMKDLGREMRVFGRSVTSAATSQITDLSVGMISR